MTTTTTQPVVIDPEPDTTVEGWTHRAWMAVAFILGDIAAGIVAALTSNNTVLIGALIGLVPAGIALHFALAQVEKAEVR